MTNIRKCLNCLKNEANYDSEYGYLYCDECNNKFNQISKPTRNNTYDFASPTTKKHRKEYGSEMYQPFSGDGVLSKEYLETWGTQGITATKEQIKNAKYIYRDMTRHHKMLEDGKQKSRKILGYEKEPEVETD